MWVAQRLGNGRQNNRLNRMPRKPRGIGSFVPSLLVVALAVALGGCISKPQVINNTNSPFYKIPPGSLIRLEQKITIPTGRTRIWIQGGEVVGTGFNSFEPSCNVEVTYLDETGPQTVAAGEYRVTRTQFLREAISSSGQVMVAAKGEEVLLADAVDSGGDEFFYEGYHLWVENPQQPDVRRFTCRGLYGFPYETRPPSIAEIRAALGPVATLELPPGAEQPLPGG